MIKCFSCGKAISSKGVRGHHEECYVRWFNVSPNTEFRDLDPKNSSTLQGASINQSYGNNSFYHGRYRKYSARLGSTEYILKVEEDGFPELPASEYLCNKIALLLDIKVPDCYLIENDFIDGRKLIFLTRNFMQDYVGTLTHLFRFLPEGEENYNCEEIIKTIIGQTGRLIDVVNFIKICLFDSLIGNNDRHGRNLGIIETSHTKKLAPMYDNPSCLAIEGDFFLQSHINPSGKIWTKESNEPKPQDYINEFKRLGYEKIVKQFSKKVVSQSSKIIETIEGAFIGEKRKQAFTKLLIARIEDFENVKQ